jgi:hypothetical protein
MVESGAEKAVRQTKTRRKSYNLPRLNSPAAPDTPSTAFQSDLASMSKGYAPRVRLKVPVITGQTKKSGRGLRALQNLAGLLALSCLAKRLGVRQSSAAFA